jgi:hypothetical protein
VTRARALLIAGTQMMDLVTTTILATMVGWNLFDAGEMNPLARFLYDSGGIWGLALGKLIVIPALILLVGKSTVRFVAAVLLTEVIVGVNVYVIFKLSS